MAGRLLIASLCWVSLLSQSVVAQHSYPRVYGPTGHPYGPTQAHYQYERQYGHPWHGYGGSTTTLHNVGAYPNGYPLGTTGGYGFQVYFYAPGLSFATPGYVGNSLIYGSPGWTVPFPDHAAVRQPSAFIPDTNLPIFNEPVPQAKIDPVTRPPLPSTTEQKLRSLQSQSKGDELMRRQAWAQAYVEYKRAVSYAEDRSEAHFRLGINLLTTRHYETAAFHLKRALFLDPQLPQSTLRLADVFGPTSELTANSLISRLMQNVEEDVGNPERLFLLGLALHFNGDPRGRELLAMGDQLSGHAAHFQVFLADVTAVPGGAAAQPAGATPAGVPLPPPPLLDVPAPKTPVITAPQSSPPLDQAPRPQGRLPPAPLPTGAPGEVPEVPAPTDGPVLIPNP